MKAIQSIGRFLPGVIFSFALIAASLEVSSQNNWNHKSENKRDRKEYRNNHSNSDYSDNRNEGQKNDNYYQNKKGRHEENTNYSQYNSQRSYRSDNEYYNHPKYGRVYRRFDDRPMVFKHSHGNYYYFGNQFYTYHDGVGYCLAETPRQIYFRELPFDCRRVRINNQVYFRHGDLYFNHSPRGYLIVPSPIEVNFSVRF